MMLPLEEWLASKHTTLWGRAFDVHDEDSRHEAAEWLTQELNDIHAFMQARQNNNGGAD